jgi:hypothetical protein
MSANEITLSTIYELLQNHTKRLDRLEGMESV